jgi:hypothetical protein
VRKRWALDAPVDSFVRPVDIGPFIRPVDIGPVVSHVHIRPVVSPVDIVSRVINGGRYAIHGCVVLPAH